MMRRPGLLRVSRSYRGVAWLLLAALTVAYAASKLVAPEPTIGDERIRSAFRERRSGVVVQGGGVVEKILRDDLEGSRHQRFIVRLTSGQTLLVSHNIDLAPRVPLAAGDSVEFRGQYEWNPEGGVVHWTHRDPGGRRAGGWIRHLERAYE